MVGLIPTKLCLLAGSVIELEVSVPSAAQVKPTEAAVPLPDEEPAGSMSE